MNDIYIRSLERSDLMLYYRMGSDIEACRSSGAVPADNILTARQQLEKGLQLKNSFVIVEKSTDKALGIIYAMQDIHRVNPNAYMLSYRLERRYWGKGYMPQAVKMILKYLFIHNNADLVSVAHFTGNNRSKRVIEKCGFKYEGTLRREFSHWDGSVLDSRLYSVLREEYLENYI